MSETVEDHDEMHECLARTKQEHAHAVLPQIEDIRDYLKTYVEGEFTDIALMHLYHAERALKHGFGIQEFK